MTGNAQIHSRKQAPRRTCVICRNQYPKRELTRIVVGSGTRIALDQSGKASGRGAYLCAKYVCWDKASQSDTLGTALKTTLSGEDREIIRAHGQRLRDLQPVDT
jgi:hypothetical protein